MLDTLLSYLCLFTRSVEDMECMKCILDRERLTVDIAE
jgi:hypothetical protein